MGKNKGTLIVVFLLFLAIFGISITNYHPSTFLTGWDDLHSEFNFSEHFSRVLNAVWQEHQGLGTFIGATYALDFPRLVYLWILSWVLPTSLIRYAFHFSMLFVGTIGTFFVIKSFFIKKGSKGSIVSPFLGALFYLGNLGTVQYFATPYEPFSVFWGMFPWLIYSTLGYLQAQTRKNLLIFLLINFLATPLAYVPTLFYVYVIVLGILFGSYLITNRSKKAVVTVITTFFFFIAVNAFWLFPHTYWALTKSSVQQNAISNMLVTSDKYLASQQFGTLSHVALFQNLPWDYTDYSGQTTQFIIQPWHNYLDNGFIVTLGYLFFTLALVGIFTTKLYRWFVLGLFVISFLLLANNVPIAREFNNFFRQIDIVNQVFRDPFTKFIVPTIFVFAIGFSGGIMLLFKMIPTKTTKLFSVFGTIVVGGLLAIYMLPAFTGHLIADRMRVAIPRYYFDFFTYMNQQDASKRIADLPQGPVWGWMNYQWGYTGSGFLWHGMSQSILNRTFDVWNDKNEEYYWEMAYALNKRDYDLFHAVLQKYDISYIMFDSSLYFPDNSSSVFTILRQKAFIENDLQIHKVKTFGTIDLYATGIDNNNYVSIINNASIIHTTTNWLGQDRAYRDFGNYIVDQKGSSEILYPFRSLFSGRGTDDVLYHIIATPSAFIFQQDIPKGEIIYPQGINDEFTRFDSKTLHQTKSIPQIINNDQDISIASASSVSKGKLEVVLPRDDRYGSYDSSMQQIIGSEVTCEPGRKGTDKQWDQSIQKDEDSSQFLRLSAVNARTCRVIPLQDFSHKLGYLVAIKSRNHGGDTLSFWVENLTEKRSDQQVYLGKQQSFAWEYFIVPQTSDGVGYALHFDNASVSKQEATNDLAQVIVYPIPYNFLTGMKIISQGDPTRSIATSTAVTSVSHATSSQYVIKIDPTKLQNKDTIALYQTYDAGWNAYIVDGWLENTFPMLFGKKLTQHVMINNWANGWILEGKPQEIILIFWPQYLEYFGFILLPIPFIYAWWPRKKKNSH